MTIRIILWLVIAAIIGGILNSVGIFYVIAILGCAMSVSVMSIRKQLDELHRSLHSQRPVLQADTDENCKLREALSVAQSSLQQLEQRVIALEREKWHIRAMFQQYKQNEPLPEITPQPPIITPSQSLPNTPSEKHVAAVDTPVLAKTEANTKHVAAVDTPVLAKTEANTKHVAAVDTPVLAKTETNVKHVAAVDTPVLAKTEANVSSIVSQSAAIGEPSVSKAEEALDARRMVMGIKPVARADSADSQFVDSKKPKREIESELAARAEAEEEQSWESFIGSKLLSYLGIAILVLGLASLLTYSLMQMGAMGRCLTGLACGGALLAIGLFLEPRVKYVLFGRILMAGGWAVLYFCAYGAHHIEAMRIISDSIVGSIVLGIVALGILLHTLRYRSESTTGMALLLSYVTLFLTSVSLYTHLAGLILGVLIGFFAYRLRWLYTHLAGVILLYAGYGIWLYLQPDRLYQLHQLDYMFVVSFLLGLWMMLKLPDFAAISPDEQPRTSLQHWSVYSLVPVIGLLNLFGFVLVRKVVHIKFQTQAMFAFAIFFGLLYIISSQIARWRGRKDVYRIDATVALLLLMIGLWQVLPNLSHNMFSWMGLGLAVWFYSFWRGERYFRDLGNGMIASAIVVVLGKEWPQVIVHWSYGLGSGELFLSIYPSALTAKTTVGDLALGLTGTTGSALLFGCSFATILYLKHRKLDYNAGEYWREQILVIGSTVAMMWAMYLIWPVFIAILTWIALAVLLFHYGMYRRQLSLRLWSHCVLLCSATIGELLTLTPLQIGLLMGISALLLYLDGYLTYRIGRDEKLSDREQAIEQGLVFAATFIMMLASSYLLSTFFMFLLWLGIGALLFYYSFLREDDIARIASHIALLITASGIAVFAIIDREVITIFAGWMFSRYALILLLSMALFYIHAGLLRYLPNSKNKDFVEIEEIYLVSAGGAAYIIAIWCFLPSIVIALALAGAGVLWLWLSMSWQRIYLRIHAICGLSLSAYWLFIFNLQVNTLFWGISQRLISSVAILALWGVAAHLWPKPETTKSPEVIEWEEHIPDIISYGSFAALLTLIYHHTYFHGLGWAVYGLWLLLALNFFSRPRYALQSTFALIMASFAFCSLSANAAGISPLPISTHIALWLGSILLLLAHLWSKYFSPKLKLYANQDDNQKHESIDVIIMHNYSRILGCMFGAVGLFILTAILKPGYWSIAWGLFGFALGLYGLVGREKYFRWISLTCFGLAVGKILLYDIFYFTTDQKIITFISVGIALLIVSFLYNRLKHKLSDLLLKD
jgi:hypothetical protein